MDFTHPLFLTDNIEMDRKSNGKYGTFTWSFEKVGTSSSKNLQDTHHTASFVSFFKTLKTLWPLFMDEVQLPQGYSHFEEAVYFLNLVVLYSNIYFLNITVTFTF